MKNSAIRLLSDIVLISMFVYLIGLVGAQLFGYPFWNGEFDKFDYGIICGVIGSICMMTKGAFDELMGLNEK